MKNLSGNNVVKVILVAALFEQIRERGITYFKQLLMNYKLVLIITATAMLSLPRVNFAQAPDLGTASSFALFTAVGAFSNVGLTTNTGDIGTNVGAFTGYPMGTVDGEIHVADPTSAQAAADVVAAFNNLSSIPCGVALGNVIGNNVILTPNVYCLTGASSLSGNLILDGQGDPDALFIFKVSAAFDVTTFSNIILIDSTSLCNVYWQINGAFTLGAGSVFKGTVVANGAISLYNNSSLMGRGLSRVGAISLNDNTVSIGVEPDAAIASKNHEADSVILVATAMNGVGPFTYLWSPGGQTDSSIKVSSTLFAQYTVAIMSVNSCSPGKDTFEINVAFLPIELLSFNATCNNKNVILEWSTATEMNNDYYSIERGVDGKDWQTVDTVHGVGNSFTLKNYSFTDKDPFSNTSYYRLKQTDFDGRFEYSSAISVKNHSEDLTQLDIYPNPANGSFNLLFSGDKDLVQSVSVYNALGEEVYKSGSYQSAIDLSNKEDGIYFLHCNVASKYIVKKLVIEK